MPFFIVQSIYIRTPFVNLSLSYGLKLKSNFAIVTDEVSIFLNTEYIYPFLDKLLTILEHNRFSLTNRLLYFYLVIFDYRTLWHETTVRYDIYSNIPEIILSTKAFQVNAHEITLIRGELTDETVSWSPPPFSWRSVPQSRHLRSRGRWGCWQFSAYLCSIPSSCATLVAGFFPSLFMLWNFYTGILSYQAIVVRINYWPDC